MIVKFIEEIEQNFKDFFLSEVNFVIKDKVIKKGKLINMCVKDFFIIFQLQIPKGGIRSFDVPYPYGLKKHKNFILFDYKLNTLVHEDMVNFVKAKNFKSKKNSKFYDVHMKMIKV
jgi:hypothetical protein